MRRLACIFLVIASLLLCGYTEYDNMYSSGELTADAQVISVPGYFYGISITTDGSNTGTVTIYDNASGASGKKLVQDLVVPSSSTNRGMAFDADPPIAVEKGIYVDITCAGTLKYTVYFRRQ